MSIESYIRKNGIGNSTEAALVSVSGDSASVVPAELDPNGECLSASKGASSDNVNVKLKRGVLFPGFVDVHVHLREPGFSYKETIATGTLAAAAGGYTAVCAMPNLSPVPDCAERLSKELEIIKRDAVIPVYPYGSITVCEKGEKLSDMESMRGSVIALSDDGCGVADDELMLSAMKRAKELGMLLALHEEDLTLTGAGRIHMGEYALGHGIAGIPSESEWKPIERDLNLAEKSGCKIHICHISCRESVKLIREAKARGVDVTCETAPHYLLLDDGMLRDDGAFRMNPPIRSREDREALVEALTDGTVDMIATDHAPHSSEEKSRGLVNSLNGIVGLETAFPMLYTELVKKGIITLDRLMELMSYAPSERFGIPRSAGDFTVFDIGEEFCIDPSGSRSMGKSTPFSGRKAYGKCRLTAVNGRIVWQDLTEN